MVLVLHGCRELLLTIIIFTTGFSGISASLLTVELHPWETAPHKFFSTDPSHRLQFFTNVTILRGSQPASGIILLQPGLIQGMGTVHIPFGWSSQSPACPVQHTDTPVMPWPSASPDTSPGLLSKCAQAQHSTWISNCRKEPLTRL